MKLLIKKLFAFLFILIQIRTAMGSAVIELQGISILEGEQVYDNHALEQAGHVHVKFSAKNSSSESRETIDIRQDEATQMVSEPSFNNR